MRGSDASGSLKHVICETCYVIKLGFHHFKSSKRKVSKSSSIKYLIFSLEVPDCDVIVKDDGLCLLDVAQGGHVKHHPALVIRVTANLFKQVRSCKQMLIKPEICKSVCQGGRSQRAWGR